VNRCAARPHAACVCKIWQDARVSEANVTIEYGIGADGPALQLAATPPGCRLRGVRRDIRKVVLAAHPRHTWRVARSLPTFPGPALVVWDPDDQMFPGSSTPGCWPPSCRGPGCR